MLALFHSHAPAGRAPNTRNRLPDTVSTALVLQALVKMADEANDSAEVTSWAIAFFAVEKEHTQCLIMLGGGPRLSHCACLRISASEQARSGGDSSAAAAARCRAALRIPLVLAPDKAFQEPVAQAHSHCSQCWGSDLVGVPATAGGLSTMIYFLRSGVRGVRRAALRACTVMAEHAPILTAYEFATKEGEARHQVEAAAVSQAACRGPQAAHTAAPPCAGPAPARVCHHSCLRRLSGPRGKSMPGYLCIITFLSLASTKLLCSANVNWAMPKRKKEKTSPACRHPGLAGAPDHQDGVRRQPPDAG